MSFLSKKKIEHEKLCENAIGQGNYSLAVFHAAKAAEFDCVLAEKTEGRIAEKYVADAEGWVAIARDLEKKTKRSGSYGKPKKEAVKDDKAGKEKDEWLITDKPGVTFQQIAGAEDVKLALREMIILPLKAPDKTKALGLKPGGGLLLFGPPGNGKTMLGKAVANELDAAFFYASGAEIRSKWHGESEKRLRRLMQAAKAHETAVLFFDEIDGLFPKRGGDSVVDNRVVNQFLAEIGGFEDSDSILLLLGATNSPWQIDPAVFRTGRFDQKIFIGLPDFDSRSAILKMNLQAVPCSGDIDLKLLADKLENYTGADIAGIITAAKRAALSRSINEDSEPLITGKDIESAFKYIPPSTTARDMKEYARFNEMRFK